jgi:hypothetical protein
MTRLQTISQVRPCEQIANAVADVDSDAALLAAEEEYRAGSVLAHDRGHQGE